MIANVGVLMTVLPALFAAVLVLGCHIAAQALAPPRVAGSRLLGAITGPLLVAGWFVGLAGLLLVALVFGAITLFAQVP